MHSKTTKKKQMKATNGEEHMYEKKNRTIQICEIDEVVL